MNSSSLNTYGQLQNGQLLKYGGHITPQLKNMQKKISKKQRRAQNMSVDHANQQFIYQQKVKKRNSKNIQSHSKKVDQTINNDQSDNDEQQYTYDYEDEQEQQQQLSQNDQTYNSSNLNNNFEDRINFSTIDQENGERMKVKVHNNNNLSQMNTIHQDTDQRQSQFQELKNQIRQKQARVQDFKLPKVNKINNGSTQQSIKSRVTPLTVDNSPYSSQKYLSPQTNNKKIKGQDMFETLKIERETNFNLCLMENRIKKLEDEQFKAQKKIQETLERTQRYQKIQDQKNQHKKQLEDHKSFTDKQQEEYRQKFIQERIERENRVNELNNKILKEKRDNKEHIDSKIHHLMMQANLERNELLNEKRDKFENIYSQNVQGRQLRKDLKSIMEFERTEGYYKKQIDTNKNIDYKKQKIANLAKREIELMQKLQNTIKLQENAVNQLESKTGLSKKILFSRLPTDVTFTHTGNSFKQSFSVQHSPRNDKNQLLEIQE